MISKKSLHKKQLGLVVGAILSTGLLSTGAQADVYYDGTYDFACQTKSPISLSLAVQVVDDDNLFQNGLDIIDPINITVAADCDSPDGGIQGSIDTGISNFLEVCHDVNQAAIDHANITGDLFLCDDMATQIHDVVSAKVAETTTIPHQAELIEIGQPTWWDFGSMGFYQYETPEGASYSKASTGTFAIDYGINDKFDHTVWEPSFTLPIVIPVPFTNPQAYVHGSCIQNNYKRYIGHYSETPTGPLINMSNEQRFDADCELGASLGYETVALTIGVTLKANGQSTGEKVE